MAIINIYSKRQRKIRGEVNDVYQYNNIPHALRVQIIKIITDSIGFPSSNERYTSYRNEADKVYAYIHEILSKEYGVFCCLKFKLFKIMMLETLFFNDGDKMAAASKRERHLS